jgi:ferritin-like protein
MTIQEKKQAIIEKVTNSNSDEFITLLYYNMNKEINWDATDEDKNLINILLEKSQQEAREGKTISNEEMKIKIKERFENRKVILK